MYKVSAVIAVLSAVIVGVATQSAGAANVKITPLGSQDGEFCSRDRAMVFEDPDGTRVLYDAGDTVRGPDDPRLGKIDVVLLSHVHWDHLGDGHQPKANAGTCAKPDFSVKDTPESNTEKIVVAKKAVFLLGGEMASFFAPRIKAAGGDPKQVKVLRFGAMKKVGGISFASVPAVHSNGLAPKFLDGAHAKALKDSHLTAYVGPPGGYVVKFTNGLVVYLSGDTGITAEQDLVVHRYYKANLAVMNIGGTYTTGPTEAAYVVNTMVKPRSVIPSHANEVATKDGKLIGGTRTAIFKKATRVPVHVPLSGRTMQFDGTGRCVAGC